MNAKGYWAPFAAAFVVFAAAFVLLDTVAMSLQGLSLVFHK